MIIDASGVNANGGIWPRNSTIVNCKIFGFYWGVAAAQNSSILYNNITGRSIGIMVEYYSTIRGNIVSNGIAGITGYGIIINNTFFNNRVGVDGGSRIINNTVYANRVYGIRISSFNNISQNNIFNNTIGIARSNPDYNSNVVIKNNFIWNNSQSGIWDVQGRNSTIAGNELHGNGIAVLLESSRNYLIFNNSFYDSKNSSIMLRNATNNTIWKNQFTSNVLFNAFEELDSNGNTWNVDTIGNFWSDFQENPSFPFAYNISGPGDGVDYWPVGKCIDEDADTYSPAENVNCPNDPMLDCNDANSSINPGAPEICWNNADDNCDGQIDEYCDVSAGCSALDPECAEMPMDGCDVRDWNVDSLPSGAYLLGVAICGDNRVLDCGGAILAGTGLGSGLWAANVANIIVRNCQVQGFQAGLNFSNVTGATVTGNTFASHWMGALLRSSQSNTFFGNTFADNNVGALEVDGSANNSWNLSTTGNNWSDFVNNSGFPWRYVVPISGGIDWWPAGKCVDSDGDTYSSAANPNCPHNPIVDCNDGNPGINPGQLERCWNEVDDDCDGVVNEGCRTGSPLFRKPKQEVTS